MDILLPLTGLLILLAGGLGVALLIIPRDRAPAVSEVLSLSLLCGAGLISISSFLLGFLLAGRWLQAAVTVISIGFLVAGLTVTRVRPGWPLPADTISALLAIIIIVQAAVVIWLSYHFTLGWDGLLNWEIKARIAYLNNGVIDSAYLRDTTRAFSHPNYPLLIPLAEAWFYGWIGRPDQQIIKLLFPLYYLAAMGLLFAGSKLLGARSWIQLIPGLLVATVPIAVFHEGSSTSGYADFPLGVYYLAAVVYLLAYWQEGKGRTLLTVGILASLLPWTKAEGTVLWTVVMSLASARAFHNRHYVRWIQALLPGLVLMAGWNLRRHLAGVIVPRDYYPVGISSIWENRWRVPVIANVAGSQLIEWRYWGVWWLAAAICAVILLIIVRDRLQLLALVAATVFPILAYMSTYVFSTWTDVPLHITTSFPRLLVHVFLVAGLIIGLAFITVVRLLKEWKGRQLSPQLKKTS